MRRKIITLFFYFQKSAFLTNIAVATALLVFYIKANTLDEETPIETHALFVAVFQTISGLFFAWLILIFESYPIENLKTKKLLRFLGKLVYCINLCHPFLIYLQIMQHKKLLNLDVGYIVKLI